MNPVTGEQALLMDGEWEKASNGYLMSLMFIMVGLPMPWINTLATLIYYLNQRRSSRFTRWHCLQSLIAQIFGAVANSAAVYWTLSIIFTDRVMTNSYIAYLVTLILFNLVEFVATIYTAIHTRKGRHVEWWFVGDLAELLLRK